MFIRRHYNFATVIITSINLVCPARYRSSPAVLRPYSQNSQLATVCSYMVRSTCTSFHCIYFTRKSNIHTCQSCSPASVLKSGKWQFGREDKGKRGKCVNLKELKQINKKEIIWSLKNAIVDIKYVNGFLVGF